MMHAVHRYLPPELAEAVAALGIRVRRPVRGRGEGLHRSPEFGSSVEFAEYRAYSPGDPLARVDWSVYARTDRFMLRRYQEETRLRATLLLDISESLDYRESGTMTKFDYACHLASALGFALVRQGDAAGLMTFHHRIERQVPFVGLSSKLHLLLEAVEQARPGGHSDLRAVCFEAASRLSAQSLVIVISDFLDAPERIIEGLRRLNHDAHNLILLHVFDEGERRPVMTGLTEIAELETGRREVVDIEAVSAAYTAAFDAHGARLQRVCAECLGDYHRMDTREPLVHALFRLGRSRA